MFLALTMVFSVAACGKKAEETTAAETAGSTTTEEKIASEITTEASNDTSNEEGVVTAAEDAGTLGLCGLTEDDIMATDGASLGDVIDTGSQYIVPVFCADTSTETFTAWVNAIADSCREAADDGNIYQDEFTTEPMAEFNIETGMNFLQFVYKVSGHVVYVNLADSGSVENAFSCSIQVY